MMFNQRTDPVFRKMRELVQGGSLGQIRRTKLDHHKLVPPAGVL